MTCFYKSKKWHFIFFFKKNLRISVRQALIVLILHCGEKSSTIMVYFPYISLIGDEELINHLHMSYFLQQNLLIQINHALKRSFTNIKQIQQC